MNGTQLKFSRTLTSPGLALCEELKVERVINSDLFFYRSHWGTGDWTEWGYWSTFPEDTTAHQILDFLRQAGWVLEE